MGSPQRGFDERCSVWLTSAVSAMRTNRWQACIGISKLYYPEATVSFLPKMRAE